MKNKRFLPGMFLLLLLLVSCEEKESNADPIKINAIVPKTIILGETDTIKFDIRSLQILDTLEVFENKVAWVVVDRTTFGVRTYNFKLNLLYKPKATGENNLSLNVKAGGIYTEKYDFKINVVKGK